MSQFAERKEKNCLNCGIEVQGRYCHTCGQENVEPRETVWHLITHFAYDITHFDGKFFSTSKAPLLKPGFLSKEYIKGRGASYLNPIRMYIFVSAFFFLFFFSLFNVSDLDLDDKEPKHYATTKASLEKKIAKLDSGLNNPATPGAVIPILKKQHANFISDLERLKRDTTNLEELHFYKDKGNLVFTVDSTRYSSREEYDSIQRSLPPDKREGWLQRIIQRKRIDLNQQIGNNPNTFFQRFLDKLLHKFPQLLFVSLPLFALLLTLLYSSRRNNYYVDHLIYSVHLYCAMFIFIFLLIVFSELEDVKYLAWVGYINMALGIYIAWYLYKSMRNFYAQSRKKTILKLFLLLLMFTFVILLLAIIFLIFSVFTI